MNKPNTKSLFVILGAAIIIVIGANQMVLAKSNNNNNNSDQKATHVAKPDTLSLTPHTASRLHYTAPSSSSSNSQKQAEASSQPAQATSTTSVSSSQAPAATSSVAPAGASSTQQQAQATTSSTVQSAPAARTDGMNWNGHHYDISTFSGDNASIPEWTSSVYRWTELPNFYAVEGRSDAGQHISELYVGAPIVLNGKTYHVSSIDPSVLRLSQASADYVFNKAPHHAFVLQTCNDVNSTYVRFYWVD